MLTRAKLLVAILLTGLAAAQSFSTLKTWYSPFVVALLIIILTALLQKPESNDDL